MKPPIGMIIIHMLGKLWLGNNISIGFKIPSFIHITYLIETNSDNVPLVTIANTYKIHVLIQILLS